MELGLIQFYEPLSLKVQERWLSQKEHASVSAHFGLPWGNRGKCYMDGKRIQRWSKASQHVPIYLQPFTSYSEILVGISYPLQLTPPPLKHWATRQ